MSLFFYILTNRMLDRFMIKWQIGVRCRIIGVDSGIVTHIVSNEALQEFGGCILNNFCSNFIRFAVFDSCNRSLTSCAATGMKFLVSMLVLFKTAKIRLINLNRTVKVII